MASILPFQTKKPSSAPLRTFKYFTLKDDALADNGRGPSSGDLCRVSVGEVCEGLPHIVETSGGQVLCGTLTFDGEEVVLSFPNEHYPVYRRHRTCVSVVGCVVKFFCSVCTEMCDREPFVESGVAPYSPLRYRAPLNFGFGLQPEAFINWRADTVGNILYASENWRDYFNPLPKTWSYIRQVHPTQRRSVALAWSEAVKTKSHFSVECEARIQGYYRLVRNMAVPVLNSQTGAVTWFGTLHLLSLAEATGS